MHVAAFEKPSWAKLFEPEEPQNNVVVSTTGGKKSWRMELRHVASLLFFSLADRVKH